MYSNPLGLRIPPDSSFQFSCVANAARYQRVVVSQNGLVVASFGGVGEGVQMSQEDGSTTHSGATREAIYFRLLFQFSKNGSMGTFQNSTVTVDTTAGIVTTIATEDDTVLTLVVARTAAAASGQ
jgi:hypothetical protein